MCGLVILASALVTAVFDASQPLSPLYSDDDDGTPATEEAKVTDGHAKDTPVLPVQGVDPLLEGTLAFSLEQILPVVRRCSLWVYCHKDQDEGVLTTADLRVCQPDAARAGVQSRISGGIDKLRKSGRRLLKSAVKVLSTASATTPQDESSIVRDIQ
jgi:hypothetical protein